jgi:hypothetical protein
MPFSSRFPALLSALLLVGCGAAEPRTGRASAISVVPSMSASAVADPVAPVGKEAEEVPVPAVEAPPPEVARAELLQQCDERRYIVIHKAERTLELRCGDALAAKFEASLGNVPEGAKEHEGDGKTPEGEYFISMKYPSQYHRSLQLAYPNVADADAGLAKKTINATEHAKIVRAYATCHEPPQTTAMGSLIQIHGGGGGRDVGDWTLGCVAVDNAEIEVVFAFQKPGCDKEMRPNTLVKILP